MRRTLVYAPDRLAREYYEFLVNKIVEQQKPEPKVRRVTKVAVVTSSYLTIVCPLPVGHGGSARKSPGEAA